MATLNEKLASSLDALHRIQKSGRTAIRSAELSRTHLERLISAGYLRSIVKGWYMPARPTEHAGDTTAWYASMREFIAGYCDERFGDDWYVNAELSLLLHTGATALPRQVQIHAAKGKNNALALPAETSLFDYQAKDFAAPELRTLVQGLRALTLEAALVRAAPNVWQSDPRTITLALAHLKDASRLSRILLDGGHSVVAGRLAGGLRAARREDLAEEITRNMEAAGYVVVASNPIISPAFAERARIESPYCGRIRILWAEMRAHVQRIWTVPAKRWKNKRDYLKDADERYAADAYHSLSIEGYQVTPDLIEKVRDSKWSPETNEADKDDRNALAARGYYEAHLAVRESLTEVLSGNNAGNILRRNLQAWYRAMWAPSVRAGILKPSDLAGWRSSQVFIRNSMHVPLPPEAVRDAMPLLFELLTEEPDPAVQAVLGHFFFVFIHPYMDGNGRLARFILNMMLARGGWPWTVVTLEVRKTYMKALEEASVRQDIVPFASLINKLVEQQLAHPLKQPGPEASRSQR